MTIPLTTHAELSAYALLEHSEDGLTWPLLLWVPGPGWRMLSSAVLGGGWGERLWVLNAQVPPGYRRTDAAAHLAAIAADAGAEGSGVGLMTAAEVADRAFAEDGGAQALVTAGVGVHGWAAAPGPVHVGPPRAGTVNIVVALPVPLAPAAMVNAVATATEAKVQALRDAGYDASGTPTDAVCVAAPSVPGRPEEPFAGPRSPWGSRLARAVHTATLAACLRDRTRREG